MNRKGMRRVGWILLLVFGLSVVVLVGLNFVGNTYKGAQRNCLLGGAPSLAADQVARVLEPGEPLEALMPTGSYTLLPMGLACDYRLADGSGILRVTSGEWDYTAFVGSLAVGALAGGAILALSRERNSVPHA